MLFVHVASKVGEKKMSELEVYVTYYDVPTQLASLDLLKSEEIVGNTARQKIQTTENIKNVMRGNVLVGTTLKILQYFRRVVASINDLRRNK